jgi:hypothetical protein
MNENESISFKTTVRPSYEGDTLPDSNFAFGTGSPFCPANDCEQEFISAYYSMLTPESPSVQGKLNIENKTTSTPDIINYTLIPFSGNFHTTTIEENRETANSVLVFSGDLGLGGGTITIDAIFTPEFKYSVAGTFDNATKVLNFEGERITSE